MESLKRSSVNAVAWSAMERMAGQAIRFAIGIVLARLLQPAEFGLIGMIAVFMGLSQVFVNCGFGEALIRKQNTTRQDESSVFYVNLLLGAAAAATLYLAAPAIARFYAEPGLVFITRLMAVDLIVGAFGVVQTMLLTKQLNFKTQIKISLTSTTISGAIAILLAWRGFGVMSLVAQILIGDLLSTSMLWLSQSWRPIRSFSLTPLREMFAYGSRLFASGLLNSAFNEIYSIVIGRLYDASTLGFYSRARQMQRLPLDNLSGIVGRVAFPVFAKLQQDQPALRRTVRTSIRALAWINFPMMIGLACTARPLVLVLLTEKWLPCVPYVQLLCFSGLLFPLSLIHVNALSAQGRSDIFLRLEVMKKGLLLLSVVFTYRYGVTALLWGNIGVSFISYWLNSHYSSRFLDYSWSEQLQDLVPYAGVSLIMGCSMYAARGLALQHPLTGLASEVVIGSLVYIGLSWASRLAAFTYMRKILQERLSPRFARAQPNS